MSHPGTVTHAATDATSATPAVASLPAHLTPAEYAALAGMSERTARRMVARGEFPPGSVIRVGLSKHRRQARLLTARLIAAGWLLPQGA